MSKVMEFFRSLLLWLQGLLWLGKDVAAVVPTPRMLSPNQRQLEAARLTKLDAEHRYRKLAGNYDPVEGPFDVDVSDLVKLIDDASPYLGMTPDEVKEMQTSLQRKIEAQVLLEAAANGALLPSDVFPEGNKFNSEGRSVDEQMEAAAIAALADVESPEDLFPDVPDIDRESLDAFLPSSSVSRSVAHLDRLHAQFHVACQQHDQVEMTRLLKIIYTGRQCLGMDETIDELRDLLRKTYDVRSR
jgi:hypothetical protein